MKRGALAWLLLVATATTGLAQETVATTDGRTLTLNPDGTYEEGPRLSNDANCLQLSDPGMRVASNNPIMSLMAWRVTAASTCATPQSIFVQVGFHDAAGFNLVETGDQATIQPGETRQLSGQAPVIEPSIIAEIVGVRISHRPSPF